jgi:hypothetical protein
VKVEAGVDAVVVVLGVLCTESAHRLPEKADAERTRATDASAAARRHVVDDDVDYDADAGIVASGDHARELVAVPALADELGGHTLVGRPPLAAGDVLGRGRDLDVGVAVLGERGTLGLDGRPVPFEELRDDG